MWKWRETGVLTALSLCVSFGAAAQAAEPAGPRRADATRKAGALATFEVRDPTGKRLLEVLATGKPTLKEQDGFSFLDVPIGEGGVINCLLSPKAMSAGEALTRFVAPSLENRNARPARESFALLERGGLLFVEWELDRTADARGVIQAVASTDPQRSFFCMLEAAQTQPAFEKVTTGIAQTLRSVPFRFEGDRVLQRTSQLVKADGKAIGIDLTELFENPEGRVAISSGALLTPDGDRRVWIDYQLSVFADRSGNTRHVRLIEKVEGARRLDLSINKGADGKYAYSGDRMGEPLEGTFSAGDELTVLGGFFGHRLDAESARRLHAGLVAHRDRKFEVEVLSVGPRVGVVKRTLTRTGKHQLELRLAPKEVLTFSFASNGAVSRTRWDLGDGAIVSDAKP